MEDKFDAANGVLPKSNGLDQDLAESLKQYASAGSFALRRILYFQRKNTSGALPEKSDSGFASHVL